MNQKLAAHSTRSIKNAIKNKKLVHNVPRYNYNPDPFSEQEPIELQQVIEQFTRKNKPSDQPGDLRLNDAKQLAKYHHPPRPSISLSKDFIHDSLYNPHYGYFFNQVEILDTSHPSFSNKSPTLSSSSTLTHSHHVQPDYLDHQQKLIVVNRDQSHPDTSTCSDTNIDQRQIWHTPSELFKPWYAWSIARVMVKAHLEEGSNSKELKPLNIYEIGAGNGTLCCGILDYIRQNYPELYRKTKYVIIELSTRLAKRQGEKIAESGHGERATIINQSILSLSEKSSMTPTTEPCWILGMEVLDNLSRDVIRRDPISRQPFQSIVITDHNGDFHERFIPITESNNPDLFQYLNLFDPRGTTTSSSSSSSSSSKPYYNQVVQLMNKLRLKYLPFQSNLTPYEFIPSNYLILFKNLFQFFPNHKIIFSDFFHLNNSLINVNNRNSITWSWWWKKIFKRSMLRNGGSGAPVVQTRYNGITVPVSTFLVKPGLFDIFFPTDFEELTKIYEFVASSSTNQKEKEKEKLKQQEIIVKKKIDLIDQNQFLFDYLNSPDFKNSLNNFNNRLPLLPDHTKTINHDDIDDKDKDKNKGVVDSGSVNNYRHEKLPDFSLESDTVFNYYQNVKMLIVT